MNKPRKPKAPRKPSKPEKFWEIKKVVGDIVADSSRSVQEIIDIANKDHSSDKKKLEAKDIFINLERDEWDDVHTEITVLEIIEDEEYPKRMLSYHNKIISYNRKMEIFQEAMKTYDKQLKLYNKLRLPEEIKKLQDRMRRTELRLEKKRKAKPAPLQEEIDLENMSKLLHELKTSAKR